MSLTLGLVLTTIAVVVLFHLLDWLFWGTSYAHRNVYPKIPAEVLRMPTGGDLAARKAAGKTAMFLGGLVTTFAGILFVPMVWLIGPRFVGPRALIFAVLLWCVFGLPEAWHQGIYYRIPKEVVRLQAVSGFVRVAAGLLLATWMLATFRAW